MVLSALLIMIFEIPNKRQSALNFGADITTQR